MTVSRAARLTLLLSLSLLLTLGGAAGVLLGLAYSDQGTALLLGQAKRWAGDIATWQESDGSLSGPLTLRGLSLKQPGLALEIRTLTLDWQPRALLRGLLLVESLEAEGIRIALATTDSPPSGEPFNPAALRLPLDIALGGVTLRDLQLTQDDQPPQVIDHLDLAASLENNTLRLRRLNVGAPQGSLSLTGDTTLETQMPLQLQANWALRPGNATPGAAAQDIALTGEIALQGNVNWGEAVVFELDYQVSADGLGEIDPQLPPRLAATGQLRGAQVGDAIALERLSLALTDTPAELVLLAQLSQISTTTPMVDATLQWSGLQWPLTGNEPDIGSSAGSLQLAGTTARYDLELIATLEGKDIPASQWQGHASGDTDHIALQRLEGRLLGGELRVSGPLEWNPVMRWKLQVEGSDLEPEQIVPDMPGQLAFALHTSGQLHPEKGLLAAVELEQLTGTLLEYEVSLSARAQFEGETLLVQSLELQSGGNQLHASGSAAPDAIAIQWQLDAPKPGAFIPGAAGALTALGTVAGTAQAPRLQANLQGKALQLDTLSVPTLAVELEAGLEPGDKLLLELATGPVKDGEQLLLDSLQLRARGTTAQHTLAVALVSGSDKLQTRLEGGMGPGLASWLGKLTQLDAQSDDYGNWGLEQPSALSLAAGEIALANSCLRSESGPARLCGDLDWTQSTGSRFKALLRALPAQLLAPDITGELAGNIEGSLAADGTLLANASLNMTPGQIRVAVDSSVKRLDHGGGDVTLAIDAGGLNATLRFSAPEQGQVTADLQLPGFTTLPLSPQQPLAGRIRASLPDLGGLAAWIPELASSAGSLEADLQPAGTLEQPEVLGELKLTGGAADIPMAGLQLRNIELLARSTRENPGRLEITGGLDSGPGSVALSGQLDLPGNSLDLEITGERLQVYNTADARALVSPDLKIGWRDDTLKLRGQLLIPEAAITPKLGLSPASVAEEPGATAAPGQVITPSPDIVVINATWDQPGEDQKPVAPFRIDSQVQLILGDAVNVNALGLVSSIYGTVTFTNTPDRLDLLPIANGTMALKDGTFRAFGRDLDIETGQLIFANVPVNEPELNIRAVLWIDNDPEVTAAGILVTGAVTEPGLELFSRPQLEASEIQSYLLTGRSAGDKESVLSIGTYLHPQLYVGYGYNLLESTSEFNSLFSITPRYGVGTSLGEADNNINLIFTHER